MNTKPNISKLAFWDIDFEKLNADSSNYEKFKIFIITRIFERGKDDDVEEIIKFYPRETIIEILTKEKTLMNRAVYYGEKLLNIKREDFICLKQTQPHQHFLRY